MIKNTEDLFIRVKLLSTEQSDFIWKRDIIPELEVDLVEPNISRLFRNTKFESID